VVRVVRWWVRRGSGDSARPIAFCTVSAMAMAAGLGLPWPGSQAQAACAPVTGVGTPSNSTVTCSGATLNQDGTSGYGTGQQNNNTVNVQTNATVTGTDNGLFLGNGNTINLATGTTVTGGLNGLVIGTGTTTLNNNNGGTVSASGAAGLANGISMSSGALIVNNTGTISGVTTAAGGAAFGINSSGDVNVTNIGGQITATTTSPTATEAVAIQGNNITIANNTGTIAATSSAAATLGIFGLNSVVVTANSGTISGTSQGIGMTTGFGATANITNNVGGVIQGTSTTVPSAGININTGIATAVTVSNFGTISGNLDGLNTNTTVSSSVTNAGMISGTTRTGIRVNTAAITNTGTVTGLTGIFFRPGNGASSVFNSGTISGTGINPIAIQFSTGSVGNTLTLGPGSIVNGTVAGAGADLLQLGGIGSDTFNVSNIGAAQQYRGFTAFNKIDASTWTLSGAGAQNWTISAGTLIGDTTSIQGATITDNAALVFNQSVNGTYAGAIGGTGSVTKQGTGTVIFTGANTYAGGTTISAGTLQLGNGGTTGALVGNITDNGVLAVNLSNALTLSGLISGSGAFQQNGPGTTVFTGANTYTGGTTISAGMLQVGNGGPTGSLVGNITDNGMLAVNLSNTLTLSGVISGSGAFQQNGPGATIFTGTNTYTGGTTISAGTLQVGNGGTSGSLVGNIADNGVLAVNLSNTLSLSGVISGSGAFQQNGPGTTVLTATETYTGATTVNAGLLSVNGSIGSSSLLTVNAGGTVGGIGTLPSTTINGGTLSPGNSIGTITVSGNLVMTAAATYLVEVSANAADRTNVTGTATLAGTARAVFQGSSFQSQYTILSAAGGRNGTFSNFIVTNLPAFFSASLVYTPTEVDLKLTSGLSRTAGLTGNQAAVAAGIDNGINSGGGFLVGLAGLAPGQVPAALSALSGEGLSGTQETALGVGGTFLNAMMDQGAFWRNGETGGSAGAGYAAMNYAPAKPKAPVFKAMPLKAPAFEPRWRAWAAGFDGAWSLNGEAGPGSADLTHRSAGGAAGVDYQVAPDLLVGAAGGGSASSFSVPDRATSGTLDGAHVGAYAVARRGGWYTAGSVAFAAFSNKTSRTIAGVGPTESATASFDSNLLSGRLELGLKQGIGGFTVTPFAAVQFAQLWQAGFSESSIAAGGGPGVLGLTVPSRTVSSLPTFAGVQLDSRVALANAMTWTPYVRAAWVHEFDPSREVTASLITLPGSSFTVDGPRAARDAARVDAGSRLTISRNVTLFESFDGEFSARSRMYAGKAGVQVEW